MRFFRLCLILCLFLMSYPPTRASRAENEPWAAILAQMSVQQKVGQLFMVNLYGTELGERGRDYLQTYQPGAVALFADNLEGDSPARIAQFTNQIQAAALEAGAPPLFIATDHEGGRVQRLRGEPFTQLPDPLFLGAIAEQGPLEAFGRAVGGELAAVGINMNLAPVADLHTRSDYLNDQRVMHLRTWGDNPEQVGRATAWYTAGMGQAGVLGVLKHFPGHGGAADSHAQLPRVEDTYEEAMANEIRAFEVAIQNGAPAIMVGHLYYAQIEPESDLPASLSPTIIGILRQELGFEGLVMTDAMDMAAVANRFYIPEAALAFFLAGGDMFVAGPYMDWNTQILAMERVSQAVEAGEITEARLDESLTRILRLKAEYGLLDWSEIKLGGLSVPSEQTSAAMVGAYEAAATLFQDREGLLPLGDSQSVLVVYHVVSAGIATSCAALRPDLSFFAYNFRPAAWEYGQVAALAAEHERVVILTEEAFFQPEQMALVLALPPEKTIVVATQSPYDLESLGAYSSLIALYSNRTESHQAICNLLFGGGEFRGLPPIRINLQD
jgi:beta-N-acetylhexosaminidase